MLRRHSLKILTVVLALQAVLFYTASRGDATPLAAPLSAFPRMLGNFNLEQEGTVEPEVLEVLKADDTLTRTYAQPGSRVGANLFMAYFQTQRTGQSPHSPKNCLPGAGFQPVENGRIDIPVGKETININRFLVSRGESESLVLYWYQSQGRVIAGEFAAKFYLVADSIRKHRSDTALVRVVVPVIRTPESNGRAEAEKTALAFVQATYPVVKSYLPH
jgi:EpsI family protein